MAWDEKLLSDINNALKKQGSASAPAPAPAPDQSGQKKPMDMSAIEASIQASIQGSKPQAQTPPPAAPAAPASAATASAQPAMDMSAIEAAIQASVKGGKKSEPAPESAPTAVVPEVMPKAAPQPEPETPRPAKGEIVLEPVRDEEPAPDQAPTQSKQALYETLLATLQSVDPQQTAAPEAPVPVEPETVEVPVVQPEEPEVEAEPEEEEIAVQMPEVQPAEPVVEPEPEPEPDPEVTQEEITRMAFAHEPLDVGSREAAQMFLESAARIPGYLPGMRVEDAVVRADAQELETSIRETDTDTLLVLFKFLSVEIEYARDESVITGLQSLVLDVLYQRMNG